MTTKRSRVRTALKDHVYRLKDGAAWLDVKGFAVRIQSTDEGIVVDVYDAKLAEAGDFDGGIMASTYAHDAELSESETEDA